MLEKRIEIIQSSFQAGKLAAERLNSILEIALDSSIPNEFVSVYYEGLSMGIALKSISEKQDLTDWQLFFNVHGNKHTSQVYVGLGWALCQLDQPIEKVLENIDAKWKLRVLDGYGYCSALLKRRATIRNQIIPQHIPHNFQSGFDQGIGRSLWYIAKGDVERLKRNVDLFSSNRHADLWRGIGIAITFVGGIESHHIKELETVANQWMTELKVGVLMAQLSRKKAESVSTDAQMIGNHLFENEVSLIQKFSAVSDASFTDIRDYLDQLRETV